MEQNVLKAIAETQQGNGKPVEAPAVVPGVEEGIQVHFESRKPEMS